MLKRVLVLDNDPHILDVMNEVLVYEGFRINTFQNTDDILTLINQYKPDLLIIDYILHGTNGGELCRKVKNNITTCNLPVILFSAYFKIVLELNKYGCDAFIAKPFDLSDLVQKVTELVSAPQKQVLIS